jgi:thioredoxin 1
MKTLENYTHLEDEQSFNDLLQTEERVAALVYASWCPFCRRFLPFFEQNVRESAHFVAVQDNRETVADTYDIEVIPTVLYFEKGQLVKRLDGIPGVGLSENLYLKFLQDCLSV